MSDDRIRQEEDRDELIRLGVAGACAGNIMTFSFANYLGAGGEFSHTFSWLSFLLYLPVVVYVAKPFYIGAWNSLRQKQLSIDLPMAVASFLGFVFSTVELLRGRDDIYFDSLSGFLFLILLSRWTQKRLQRRFLRPQELMESLQLGRVRRVHESGWSWTPIEMLRPGERIILCAPETLPAEAELVSATAHVSLAWLSGEEKPRTLLRGAIVPAGARLVTGQVQLIARKPLNETSFGQILSEVQNFTLSKNRIVSLADRWAQWLLAIVFAAAIIFLVAYWNVSSEEAIRRSLSLIILACPCAMAFGAPLALASALRKAQRNGLVVRNANVFEKAAAVSTIFFDKTGTLTETDLALQENPAEIPAVYQKIILSLENESMHPIAFAFRKAFDAPDSMPPVDGWREVPGSGVSGFLYGKFYELKRNSKTSEQTSSTLFEDHQPVFQFTFTAQLKPDCADVLQNLRAKGYRLILLSGDKKEVVERLGSQLGFGPDEIHFEVDPCRKAAIVAHTPNAMMIGDGVNDSLAMMRAQVGVAVSGGMEAALRSSDVYLADPSLKGVAALFDLSRSSLHLIRRNLMISVIYNSLGGVLALLGFINPFMAAVLMPLSSGFILASTWVSGRGK
ncbi:MAG: HAD-IC family P-type ATPase [Bdellovibrionaceae bacterium]|nr:HAD-IC family P-type ATPase [Pseudobdellovibrionaceae bacterium]